MKQSCCLFPDAELTLNEAEDSMLGKLPYGKYFLEKTDPNLVSTDQKRQVFCFLVCLQVILMCPSSAHTIQHDGKQVTRLGVDCCFAELLCQRAQMSDGLSVLELSQGWGSLGIYIAAKYPTSQVTVVCDNHAHRLHIGKSCRQRGLSNLQVFPAVQQIPVLSLIVASLCTCCS